MQDKKKFTSHLCTFMGREANLKILIPYIDSALKIGAVDNYWFIDMTRKRSDHELIKKLSAELNDKYPGRVHLYNSEERGKIIDDEEKLNEATKSWETFYKFLTRFNDDDIIAKCDDDTYYIDVETLKAAYQLRWDNKKPYLMHANAINNGLSAYQMKKHGILDNKELELYPSGGLTGPLFSHPEVACKNHDKFTKDMLANPDNINKYKLKKNIQFCNRVSINFIFMLGKDRHELSKITYQDEYDTSSKYPQREDRPNVLIGDFIMAHHTYGVQEPVMEELKTHIGYEKLCEKLNTEDSEFEHKDITANLNATTTIGSTQGQLLMRSWVEKNSYAIKNPEKDEYISLEHQPLENQQNGTVALKTNVARSSSIKEACIFNIDQQNDECIYIHNSMMMLKLSDDPSLSFPIYKFFQAGYQKNKIKTIKKGNKVTFKHPQKDLYLAPKRPHENLLKNDAAAYHKMYKFLVWEEEPFEWELEHVGKHTDDVVLGVINRAQNFDKFANDETTAKCLVDDLPDNNCPREWIWMVKDYIWEMVPNAKQENAYRIKLVADDKPDLYLAYKKGKNKLITNGCGDLFEFLDGQKSLKHIKSGKYVSIKDGEISLSSQKTGLAISPEK